MSAARWLAVMAALGLAAAAGCKRSVRSSGTCEGTVGRVAVNGPLDPASSYHVDWSHTATPAVLKLDCAGKLVLVAFLPKRLPATGAGRWTISSDDPGCAAAGGPDAGEARLAPRCAPNTDVYWATSAPKGRPLLATGSLEAALDESKVLAGKAELRFVDGTVSTIRFALDYGEVDTGGAQGVNVSIIPGRLSFTEQ